MKQTKLHADPNATYHQFPGGCYAEFRGKVAEVRANPSGVEIQWFKKEGEKQVITRVALTWEAAHATALLLAEAVANIRPTFEEPKYEQRKDRSGRRLADSGAGGPDNSRAKACAS